MHPRHCDYEDNPLDKLYKLTHCAQHGAQEQFHIYSDDLAFLVKTREVLAQYDEHQFEANIRGDYVNWAFIERWVTVTPAQAAEGENSSWENLEDYEIEEILDIGNPNPDYTLDDFIDQM